MLWSARARPARLRDEVNAMLRKRRTDKGFSMIELAVVIAIIGVVAVISIPNLMVWLSRNRLSNATVRLERTVGIGKKLAISSQQRHCMTFTSDATAADTNSEVYHIGVLIYSETTPDQGDWLLLSSPPETSGWTNDATTELYRSISLHTDLDKTTLFSSTDECAGLLFNSSGYLDNPNGDFATACGGENCARLTLRNKGDTLGGEMRTLWIDQGANVRITQGPTLPPVLGP